MGYIKDYLKHLPLPSITLRAHCMAALGFETGKKVEVLWSRASCLSDWLRSEQQV
ncbi:hypothetical protein [Erwinia sp. MMLR14_017]|uniref:hypothetical protein n=1 Tax=Erwinia sp. MMLR14_017 TaxID=3093842 RepID=UPI0039A2C766